jgi:hypothetical protein
VRNVQGKVHFGGNLAVDRAPRGQVRTLSSESVRLSQLSSACGRLTMRRCTPDWRNARPTRRPWASSSWRM